MTSAPPLLAALLRRALPDLSALDHAPAGGGLYPWIPGAMVGAGDPAALPPALAGLLAGFRQAGGTRPLAGFDPARDAALASGAPEAWGRDGAAPRLLVAPGGGGGPGPPFGLGAWIHGGSGAMVLARGAAPVVATTAERVMLLLGVHGAVERADLLLPDGLLPRALGGLEAAARAMAEEGGRGWEFGLRAVSPRLATLTLLAPDAAPFLSAVLPRGTLVLEEDAARGRLRLLLGALPAGRALRLRVLLGGGTTAPPPALFLDGARHALGRAEADEAGGGTLLEAAVTRGDAGGAPAVLGLAGTGGAGAAPQVERVEIAPA